MTTAATVRKRKSRAIQAIQESENSMLLEVAKLIEKIKTHPVLNKPEYVTNFEKIFGEKQRDFIEARNAYNNFSEKLRDKNSTSYGAEDLNELGRLKSVLDRCDEYKKVAFGNLEAQRLKHNEGIKHTCNILFSDHLKPLINSVFNSLICPVIAKNCALLECADNWGHARQGYKQFVPVYSFIGKSRQAKITANYIANAFGMNFSLDTPIGFEKPVMPDLTSEMKQVLKDTDDNEQYNHREVWATLQSQWRKYVASPVLKDSANSYRNELLLGREAVTVVETALHGLQEVATKAGILTPVLNLNDHRGSQLLIEFQKLRELLR